MELILNSKFFDDLPAEALGRKAKALGYTGLDLCVRPGHPVHLDNVAVALPQAARIWQDQGVSVPLVSAPVHFNNPDVPAAEALYAACAAASVPRIKIGYWYFTPGDDYWDVLQKARDSLAGFARLSEKYQIQTCCHIHSGLCIGSNCAGLMQLLQGFDPVLVGAYPDFGHMALDGEDMAMGLAMIRSYLCCVGIKDAFHAPQKEGSVPPYVPIFTSMGNGSVDWRRAIGLLAEMGYAGPLAVHTEYQFGEHIIRQVGYALEKPPSLEENARQDAAFLKAILEDLTKE
jgi:sugar phosphate isomerase/epimerase